MIHPCVSIRILRHAQLQPAACRAAVQTRHLLTLAIETSCDDTSVAVLAKSPDTHKLKLHFHAKVTANNLAYKGVHPLVSQHAHEQNLATLIADAIQALPADGPNSQGSAGAFNASSHLTIRNAAQETDTIVKKPDFISVTRGPGMRSSLNAGLNTAKGLAVAWQRPLLGVNHMQAHALTPRLVSAMQHTTNTTTKDKPMSHGPDYTPQFPFLSLLVSGGHTMLLRSASLCSHPTLATTIDIAVGDAIDKMARDILPPDVLSTSSTTMYGPALEKFAFPAGVADYAYIAPRTRKEEIEARVTRWGWALTPPLVGQPSARPGDVLAFSFTGVCSAAQRVLVKAEEAQRQFGLEERRELAREAMRVVFEHLASRVVTSMQFAALEEHASGPVDTLVVSGGVAANGFLRHVLRANLDARGFTHVQLAFPPLHLCTDNAAMIGWAGIEMFEAGWTTDLGCHSLRKWSLDPAAEDGGILGVTGWQQRSTVL